MEKLTNLARNQGFVFQFLMTSGSIEGISLSFPNSDGSLEHFLVLNEEEKSFKRFLKEIFSHSHKKICFDMRSILQAGLKLKGFCDVIDVSLLYNAGDDKLYRVVNVHLKDNDVYEFIEKNRRVNSHIKACKIAKIDVNKFSLCDILPKKLNVSFHRVKNEMIWALYMKKGDVHQYKEYGYHRAKALYEIETNGIKVNPAPMLTEHHAVMDSFVRHVQDKVDENSFVWAKFIPQKSKTGRSQMAKGSFRCMNVPKGPARRAIISRFEGGKIASIDLNAADYRCVISAVDDYDLNMYYKDCEDFHDRSVELVFPNDKDFWEVRRKVIKYITYFKIYGGSVKNISKSTGLKPEKVTKLIDKMFFLDPITEWSKDLRDKSIKSGYVKTFTGHKIPIKGSESAGKILALFAQSCTNDVFMQGLVNSQDFLTSKKLKTVILFPVHDELVLDVHPDEIEYLNEIKDIMELGSGIVLGTKMKAKLSLGNNYWDLK